MAIDATLPDTSSNGVGIRAVPRAYLVLALRRGRQLAVVQELERDPAIEVRVVGGVDGAHAAFAQRLLQDVATDALARVARLVARRALRRARGAGRRVRRDPGVRRGPGIDALGHSSV